MKIKQVVSRVMTLQKSFNHFNNCIRKGNTKPIFSKYRFGITFTPDKLIKRVLYKC